MKKNILLTALILITSASCTFAGDIFDGSTNDLEGIFAETFYEAPSTTIPEVKVKEGSTMKEVKGNPLFRRIRVNITNYLREREYIKAQKELEADKKRLEAELNELNIDDIKEEITEEVQKSPDTLELEGAVKQQITSNDVVLDADNIDYDDKTLDITATGSPTLTFPPQNVKIKADKLVYNQASNILKAFGNVEVIRDNNHIYGDYMQINMNEESSFLDNMNSKEGCMTVKAEKAEMDDDKITLHKGELTSEDSYILNLQTKMIGGMNFNRMLIDDDDKSSITSDVGDTAVHLKAKEIFVNAKRDHDVIKIKKGKVSFGDTKIFSFPSFTIHTNKKHEYFDANYPEFGSRARLGMFAGPGFVFDTPLQGGSTLKVIPIINNKNGIGIGGMFKYRSATNFTHFGYGSSEDIFFLKGKQFLDDKLQLHYGANSYMDEWFLGARMPKYKAELIYKDQAVIPSTIKEGLNLEFSHRFGLGYMQNTDYSRHGEHIPASNIGTVRGRYMAQVSQSLFKYTDKEKLRSVDLKLVMQGSAALYGTGDTQFIGRIGPMLHSQVKYWMQDIGLYQSAFEDNSPMQMYDMYRYGRTSAYIREAIRLHKYLSIAWAGMATLTGDSPDGKLFQENAFILAIGPDDFKVNIGYDFIRGQTYFACVVAMDTKGSSVEYEKMEIKNPDRLAKSNDKKPQLKVFGEDKTKSTPKRIKYAEVIDIEDPDREQI